MSVDKNQAMIDYLLTCPTILADPLFFNIINAEDGNNQIVTESNDIYANKRYIDGSILKIYTLTIVLFKSAAENAIPKIAGYDNENISDMNAIQALIDWIAVQEQIHNYPNFGTDCEIDSIETTTENPVFNGIDTQVSPPLAVYSVAIRVTYIDTSKKIWG